jgi:hypothetical protein
MVYFSCHLGDLGSNIGQAKFLQLLKAFLRPTHYFILCTGVKTGVGDSLLDKGMEFDL